MGVGMGASGAGGRALGRGGSLKSEGVRRDRGRGLIGMVILAGLGVFGALEWSVMQCFQPLARNFCE